MKLPIIAASIVLSACIANRTTIESSWTDAGYSGPPLGRVAIVALFPTRADSLAFERHATDYLAANGVAAVPAHALLTPAASQELDEGAVRKQIAAAANVDGVLLFRLVAVDERREYQVPTPYLLNAPPDVTPPAFSANPPPDPSYYWFSSTAVGAPADETAAPGYWIEQTFLVAETALFDNRTDRLLWTAKSETMDDARFARTSESIVRTVARQLFAMDLIARTAAPPERGQVSERG
jgi:hypothetical protein